MSSAPLSVSLSSCSSSPPFPYPVVLSLSFTDLYFLVRFAILFLHCWAEFSLSTFSRLHLSCSCLAIECHSGELNDRQGSLSSFSPNSSIRIFSSVSVHRLFFLCTPFSAFSWLDVSGSENCEAWTAWAGEWVNGAIICIEDIIGGT